MTTFSAIATLDDELNAAGLGDALEALAPSGVGVFEIEDGSGRWEVGAYFLDAPDETALALLAAAFDAAPFVISVIPDQDWIAQVRRDLSPVRAGRFIVHGGHDRSAVPPSAIALEIEAAMAFGTGHHGTTEGCLLLLDRLHKRGWRARRVADVGCGTGVLAMAAARLPGMRARGMHAAGGYGAAPRIVAGDIDSVAAATARANMAANRLRGRVAVSAGAGFTPAPLRGARFDLVLANILARPLKRLAPQISARLSPGGVAILSGLLARQRRDVLSAYGAWGFKLVDEVERRGWASLALRRGR